MTGPALLSLRALLESRPAAQRPVDEWTIARGVANGISMFMLPFVLTLAGLVALDKYRRWRRHRRNWQAARDARGATAR